MSFLKGESSFLYHENHRISLWLPDIKTVMESKDPITVFAVLSFRQLADVDPFQCLGVTKQLIQI